MMVRYVMLVLTHFNLKRHHFLPFNSNCFSEKSDSVTKNINKNITNFIEYWLVGKDRDDNRPRLAGE